MELAAALPIIDAAINGVEAAVAAWPTVKALLVNPGSSPTPEQQALIDAATDAAHAALQADNGPSP